MPFKSRQQMKACFATNGFGGKIDCDEWAKATNTKSLPQKKEDGGYNMYRPKNCKKCGGRMQSGGPFPAVAPPPTADQLAAANAEARRFSASHGLMDPENMHVGNTLPQYVDIYGKPAVAGPPDRIPSSMVSKFVPPEITSLDWDASANLPYYTDPQTGNMQYTQKDFFYSPRFQKPKEQQALLAQTAAAQASLVTPNVAMRMVGGYLQQGGMPHKNASPYDAPLDLSYLIPTPDQTAQDAYSNFYAQQNMANVPKVPQAQNRTNQPSTLQNIGIGMTAGVNGAAFLSGAVERRRQNQYDYKQQTALGQMNPIQASDFQPNPYSLYAKYGGNLKTILRDAERWSNDAPEMDMTEEYGPLGKPQMKKGGYEFDRMLITRKIFPELFMGRMKKMYKQLGGSAGQAVMQNYYDRLNSKPDPSPSYNFSALRDNPNADDSAEYRAFFNSMKQGSPNALNTYARYNQYGVPRNNPNGGPTDMNIYNSNMDQLNAYNDYLSQKNKVDITPYLASYPSSKKPTKEEGGMIEDEMKQGGNWLKGAVNPAHKGWCTPLSNPHCTGRRRAFALMMKKNHGFHNKD